MGRVRLQNLGALLVLASILLALAPPAASQAFCALRDPRRQIASLFPESDGYESVVGTVGKAARARVAAVLPFTLHFNELGRHTLYVVRKEGEIQGLVHVRSEAGKWGLVEIAWALDLNLNVLGFEFQRCRDRSRSLLLEPRVAAHIEGSSFRELRRLLDEEGGSLSHEARFIPEPARPLGAAVVRNGLKTVAVTACTWKDEIDQLRAYDLAHRADPLTSRAEPLLGLFGPEATAAISHELGPDGTGIDRSRATAFVILDEKKRRLGRVVMTPWSLDDMTMEIRWFFRTDGTIRALETHGGSAPAEVRNSLLALVGTRPAAASDCAGAIELVALEVAMAERLAGTYSPAERR